VQLPILLGLYSGLRRVVANPHAIIDFSYGFMHKLPWIQQLSTDIHQFDATLFGFVDLTKSALPPGGGIYVPAFLLVIGSAIAQYYQSKQLMPVDKEARSLRQILKSAGDGKQADQSEVSAAVGRSTLFLLPAMVFIFTVHYASALSLYWLVSGLVALIQQTIILGKDVDEMEAMTDKSSKSDKAKNAKPAKIIAEPKASDTANVKERKPSTKGSTVTSVTISSTKDKEPSIIEGEVVSSVNKTTSKTKARKKKKRR